MALVGSALAIVPAEAVAIPSVNRVTPGLDGASVAAVIAADVGVNVTAPSFPEVGANFNFTIKVTNHGPNAATGVSVTDSLPTGVVTFQAVSSSDPTDSCSGTSYIICSLGSLATAEVTTIVITVRRDKPDQTYDYANVASDADPYADNNSDAVLVQPPLGGSFPADLAIVIQAPSSPAIGASYDYTITVTNYGPNPATNVKITDFLPSTSQATFTSVSPTSCSYLTGGSSPRVGCYFDSLGNGSSVVITITVTRVSGYPFYSSANVVSDADPFGSNNFYQVSTSADPSATADMGITAQAPSAPPVGSNFNLTLTATNHGPSRATTVTVYVDLSGGQVSFVSVTPSVGCAYSSTNQSVNCTFPSIANGGSATITVALRRIASGSFQLYSNVYSDLDLTYQNNSTYTTIGPDLNADADVGITMHAPSNPATGSTFAYAIDVTNHGPSSASNIYLSDNLPSQVSYVSSTAGCRVFGVGDVECSLGSLADAATTQVLITVRRVSGMSFQNDAYVNSAVDLNDENDTDFAIVLADSASAADVGVTISAPSSPPVGSAFTYTMAISNHGPATATHVRLANLLPAQVTYQSSTPLSACSYLNGARKVSCNFGSMTNGATRTVTITVTRNLTGSITDTAQLTSDLDLNASNDAASVTIGTSPVLLVNVSDSGFAPQSLTAGIGWVVQWAFNGPSNQSVTDSSGMGLFDSGVRASGSTYSFAFFAAGIYAYRSSLNTSLTGKVSVPLVIAPASGTTSTSFTVTWASSAPPSGYVVNIQRRNPGSTVWTAWLSNQTGLSAAFTAGSGAGTYSFRARLSKSNGTKTGWSPAISINVT